MEDSEWRQKHLTTSMGELIIRILIILIIQCYRQFEEVVKNLSCLDAAADQIRSLSLEAAEHKGKRILLCFLDYMKEKFK